MRKSTRVLGQVIRCRAQVATHEPREKGEEEDEDKEGAEEKRGKALRVSGVRRDSVAR